MFTRSPDHPIIRFFCSPDHRIIRSPDPPDSTKVPLLPSPFGHRLKGLWGVPGGCNSPPEGGRRSVTALGYESSHVDGFRYRFRRGLEEWQVSLATFS
ncbi:hypothetical protein SBA2_490009 [Acidobacteriia bacterium SbA2]|nr:hypothetical protein SBA2_490009 [Acidobacteriia bacterium SbA2]